MLDLSIQDVVRTIPEITDLYWVYPVIDSYVIATVLRRIANLTN